MRTGLDESVADGISMTLAGTAYLMWLAADDAPRGLDMATNDKRAMQIGFQNRSEQTSFRTTGSPGTDHEQVSYALRRGPCSEVYGTNDSDIQLSKCPACQGVPRGLAFVL